jgi:hypothetical protein
LHALAGLKLGPAAVTNVPQGPDPVSPESFIYILPFWILGTRYLLLATGCLSPNT